MQLTVYGKKWRQLMSYKKTFLLFLLFFFGSIHSKSQQISISFKNAPLQEIFKEIEKQTSYRFVYTKEEIKESIPVTVQITNQPVETILIQIFKNQPLSYSIDKNYILIHAKEEKDVINPTQNQSILRGKVLDEEGQPLQGASITIKNTAITTISDEKGQFLLPDINPTAVIVITSVGYSPKEIVVKSNENTVVKLKQSVSTLDESIVIAYGTTTKRLSTGSVSKVREQEIRQQPVLNPLTALSGRVPGLIITETSGVPGSSVKVELRGRTTLDATLSKNNPLFIIDGVPFAPGNNVMNRLSSAANKSFSVTEGGLSPFSNINPGDIESIEVLKDADATAIYGSRGANGVILITTKKGIAGQTRCEIYSYYGISRVTRTMDMLNTTQYLEMRREALKNDGDIATLTNAMDLVLWDTTRYTDWKEELISGTAKVSSVQTSVSGGTANTQFLLSGSYHYQTTVFPGDMGYRRGTANLSLKHTSTSKKFSISLSSNFSTSQNNLNVSDLTRFIYLPPNFPSLYDSLGKLKYRENGTRFSPHENPLSYLLKSYSMSSQNLITNLLLSYRLSPSLVFRTSLGYNLFYTDETSTSPSESLDPLLNVLPSSNFANSYGKNWVAEPQLEYSLRKEKHHINILFGSTWQQEKYNSNNIAAQNYTSDLLLYSVGAAGNVTASNNISQYNYNAIFGRLNYNYENKYLLNLTGRRDGSSRFSPENRFENFGALGAGWIFSNEKFMQHLPFISFGKIRGSYGITGNDQIGDYLYLDTWKPTTSNYQGMAGLQPTRLYNPGYSWEINKKLELAIESGFLKDRIITSVAWFSNRSSNQLINYKLPNQTGFNSITRNLPALVENKGLEITIQTKNFSSKSFSWESFINFSRVSNKLISFPGLSASSYAAFYIEGQPLNVLQGLIYRGVDPLTGVYSFEDLNRDGLLNTSDYIVHGTLDPKFYGGLQNNIRFKDFQLDVFVEFRKQTGRNYLADQSSIVPGLMYNNPVLVLNRWQKPGDISGIQKYVSKAGQPAYTAAGIWLFQSSAVFSDASFLRLKNLSFSYSLSESVLNKIHFQKARVFINAQNLFTITNYIGADPEPQSLYVLPPLRTISCGFQITF